MTYELLRTPLRRSSVGPGPRGQEFSGNCDVASRNTLLHNGATNATRLRRSDSEEAPPCHARGPGSCLVRSLATANFRELLFPRRWVHKEVRGQGRLVVPALLREVIVRLLSGF